MNFSETLKLALAAVWAHKLRSFLTLLGMIIGMTAFMIVVSLIQGFNTYVDEKIAGIGTKSFTVQRFNPFTDFKDTDTIAAAQRRNKEMTLDEFEYLKTRATLVGKMGAAARPSLGEVKRGSEVLQDVQVSATTPIVAEIQNTEIEDGRYFLDAENDAGMNVAFIGADVASKLFPAESPVNQEIIVRGLPYRVVGVAVAKGTVFGIPQDTFITIPLKTYQKNFGPLIRQRSLYFIATAKNDNQFADAVEEARFLLRARRQLKPGDLDNFGIVTPDAITGLRDRLFGTISLVALVVPGIALVVGAIVIMNIMLVSVTERTKEIGIRKSLGARRNDILKQFIVESATLAAIGGILGLTLAWILSKIVSMYIFQTYLSVEAVIFGIAVSGVVGILAGLFPAWRAARLDPIEALRSD